MTVESFMREHPRPLLLVPVHFSYEKLLEGRTLVAELEGQPKAARVAGRARARRQRTSGASTGACTSISAPPLSIDQFLDREAPGWHALQGDEQRDTARRLTPLLGREMAQRINSAVVINPINLFAMAIVPSPRQALDERATRAADRLAEDDRVPAALFAGCRAHARMNRRRRSRRR